MHVIATVAVIAVRFLVKLRNNHGAKRHDPRVCLTATVVLLAIARLDGLSWASLGLARNTWHQGIYWSIGLFLAVALFYAIAASLPVTRRGFNDKRAAEKGWLNVLYHSMIRIPFGTALLEETAFRGVLLAVVTDGWNLAAGITVSSILFGFWHVLPSLEFHDNHEAAGMLGNGRRAQVRSVVFTVLGTGAAGVGFCLLRGYTDSLFPPIALHASLNGIGLAVSWAFARRLRDL